MYAITKYVLYPIVITLVVLVLLGCVPHADGPFLNRGYPNTYTTDCYERLGRLSCTTTRGY